ncbi:MAG: DUF6160 family protein [Moraxellaceae bacterium]
MKSMMLLPSVLLFCSMSFADQLKPMDDADLSGISGQSGVALDLVLQTNADESGNPLSSQNYCTGTVAAGNGCRMAFQFHNRGSGGGEWVVWKDFFGVLKMNNIWLDAAETSLTASPYPDVGTNNRFMSSGGSPTCLPDSSKTAATCASAVRGIPMLSMQTNLGAAGGLQLFLNLGRVAVEYGATGYNADLRGPALGVLIGDVRGTDLATPSAYAAQVKIGGKIGLYGF